MNLPAQNKLDKAATGQLAIAIMKLIRSHYMRRPRSELTTFEVLKALAMAAGSVLNEWDLSRRRDWFDACVDDYLAAISNPASQREDDHHG